MAATVQEVVIAQRDLRNRVGEILRQAQAGQSFVITTRGERVARLVPSESPVPIRGRTITRPAKRHGGWDEIELAIGLASIQETLDDLRGDR